MPDASDQFARDVSILPGRGKISFWVYSLPGGPVRGFVFDLQKMSPIAELGTSNQGRATAIAWSPSGLGAFAEPVIDGSGRRTAVHFVEQGRWSTVKTLDIQIAAAELAWIGDTRLAVVGLEPDGDEQALRFDLYFLDTESGRLNRMTRLGDVVAPAVRVSSGEVWCLRDTAASSSVHCVDFDNEVWESTPERFLDKAVSVDRDGRILLLNTHPGLLPVFLEMIRYPSRAKRVWPVIPGRSARATSASLFDGITHKEIWRSLPGAVYSGSLGSNGRIALSVLLEGERYALAEHVVGREYEKIVARSEVPLLVVGDVLDGWIVQDESQSIFLASNGRLTPIFESMEPPPAIEITTASGT